MPQENFEYRTSSQVVEDCERMMVEWQLQADNETDLVSIEICLSWIKKWGEAAEYAKKNKPKIPIGGSCRRLG